LKSSFWTQRWTKELLASERAKRRREEHADREWREKRKERGNVRR